MMKMSGAQILIKLLERQGIDTIFGIPGGAILPIYDALSQSEKINHILCRHEQGAGFMAQGYARSTGETAVFFATSGPGATNTLTAFADAKFDSVPVVCITGQVSSQLLGTDAFQEVDIYGMTIPVAKHNFLIRKIEELFEVIPKAFEIAASGRPGPVLVDIPRDIQLAMYEFEDFLPIGKKTPMPEANIKSIAKAIELLKEAKKPVLMVGGGVISSNSSGLVRKFSKKTGIPVAMSLLGLGAMPANNVLNLGLVGMHGAKYTNMVLDECDFLMVAGARLDDRATGKAGKFCPNAKIVHIDIDRSELGKIRHAHIDIVGDVNFVLQTLIVNCEKVDRTDWHMRIQELKHNYPLITKNSDNPKSPYGIIMQTAKLVGDDAIITTDVGQHQMRVAQSYPFSKPRQLLSSGGLGTMGFGLPAAIGAAMANPSRTVVCFTGDGSFLMNIQELATLAERNLNVKIVLVDNHGLGLIHQLQDLFFEKRLFAWQYTHHVDFIKVAEGFGIDTLNLNEAEDPLVSLKQALTNKKPMLIYMNITPEDKVLPIVPPGAANIDMIGGE